MRFLELENIVKGKTIQCPLDRPITDLLTDSRKTIIAEGALFFAISGDRHNGHYFIYELYRQGIRQFVIDQEVDYEKIKEANVVSVKNSIEALQSISIEHRKKFRIPVIGITGSNGKTTVKEWLFQLLVRDFFIVKNPGSYNSQIGVPLSVWNMQPHHNLGIFEAGISKKNEMTKLENIIQPTIGILTNIGSAHDEGFSSREDKTREKLALFRNVEVLIYNKNHQLSDKLVKETTIPTLSWGFDDNSADINVLKDSASYQVITKENRFALSPPFIDFASIENCFHCVALLLYMKFKPDEIQERINLLRAVPMRLELKEGINQCQIIDDTYNNDLNGIQIGLDFLAHQHQKKRKRLILSDIFQSGLTENELVQRIAILVNQQTLDSFVGIGPVLSRHRNYFNSNATFYDSTDDFLRSSQIENCKDEVILVKGARSFEFERIVRRMQRKVHGTVMEIDLGNLVGNLNYVKTQLPLGTKIMVMVKAFAYGSGSTEIANVLQYHRVDYLGVAYADEGVDLRKNNITIPVMVMNPSQESFDSLLDYQLEPEIYSFKILNAWMQHVHKRECAIHIKLDTGMHRLGFEEKDLDLLIDILKENKNVRIASIFSHLAGSDESSHDKFSAQQSNQFEQWANKISSAIGYKPLYHILNSSGILRHSKFTFDMVRLGIGLYGIDPSGTNKHLKPVATLKTIISQIKTIKTGDTVGYGRMGKAEKELKIATLAIGYADGFNRAFSKGVGSVLIKGAQAPVVGNVCMDMTMVDISNIQAEEGDEAIIFGEQLPIQEVASRINTIPYEILTNTSERVKRVFVAESI